MKFDSHPKTHYCLQCVQLCRRYQLLCEFEFEGKPWEKHDLYWDRSPIAHITEVATPMLLTHGEQVPDRYAS